MRNAEWTDDLVQPYLSIGDEVRHHFGGKPGRITAYAPSSTGLFRYEIDGSWVAAEFELHRV